MTNDIELGRNHSRWMMNFYKHFIIADHDAKNRITGQEKQERVRWCYENIHHKYYRYNPSWCCSSQVNKEGDGPYWVFYFMEVVDAMAFKLAWK
ncbi:hypothetical protein LCGC14_2844140 [marine sediment metagenome]|uniref:Uncharacterized protein n=1 Tax=marine sediment metagenome TaxID=412755 RepID=A0A0F8YX27_9ZZZZ